MQSFIQEVRERPKTYALFFLMFLSFFTIVHNYAYPPALFWDENYHIASAQKYLNGVYFMEPHPPLGKLLIALGEKIVNANPVDDQFIGTDYATNPPAGFSFAGYRLFPTLLAWFAVPVLFGIFWLLSRKTLHATVFTLFYALDNAMIVHNRSAMLESTLLFFGALTVLAFLLLLEWKDNRRKFAWASLLFGAAFGLTLATKAFGLIFILFVPALAWALRKEPRKIVRFGWMGLLAFLVAYCGVWQLHFGIGSKVVSSLPDDGYYQASQTYETILQNHQTWNPLAFPVMLRDSINFVGHYQRGVPRLDLCKADENGSPWFFWPFGARSISYRWETPDGNSYRYLYLQSNPVVWAVGLGGILLSLVLLLGHLLLPVATKLKHPFRLLTFLIVYLAFLAAVSQITRVMYLYHYFVPLVISFVVAALVFDEVDAFGPWKLTERRKDAILLGAAALAFASFEFFAPLTYYKPLTDDMFKKRDIFPLWELRCVHCSKDSLLVVPR